MPRPTRKRKHHNDYKRAQRITTGLRIEHWESWGINPDGTCVAKMSVKNSLGRSVLDHARDSLLITSLLKMYLNWRVRFIVKCRAPDGTAYETESEVIAKNIRLEDLHEVAKQERAEIRLMANQHHIWNEGWIAEVVS